MSIMKIQDVAVLQSIDKLIKFTIILEIVKYQPLKIIYDNSLVVDLTTGV